MSEEILTNICPRCGGTGYIKIKCFGERCYYYFVHWNPAAKRKTYCYVGPVDEYYVVNAVYEDKALDLPNVLDVDLIEVAKRAIRNYVNVALEKNKKNELSKAYHKLQQLHKLIHKALKALEAERAASTEQSEVVA